MVGLAGEIEKWKEEKVQEQKVYTNGREPILLLI